MVAGRGAWLAVVWIVASAACGSSTPADTGASSGGSTTGNDVPTETTTDTGVAETGTSTGTGSTSEVADSSSSGSFLISPDLGTSCITLSLCDLWAQDCGEGEKCVPWIADGSGELDSSCLSTRCSPLPVDAVPPGGTCTIEDGPWSGFDDCEIGSFCWDVDGATLQGTCVSTCLGSEADPLCEDGEVCFQAFGAQIIACVDACDPLGAPCEAGFVCVASDGAPTGCVPEEFDAATGQGAPCEHQVGCTGGFACMNAALVPGCEDPGSCCTAVCDPQASECAGETPVCTPLDGDSGIGACTIE